MDFRISPTSDVNSDSFSMRDKSLLKRSISKNHNHNLKAGYVPVHEQYLNKTGLRGRKTFAFWTLIGLLFILAVGNLLLTVTILSVLRLGQGMASIELIPEEYSIKFFGVTDLDHIYKRDGKIEGFDNEPIEISSKEGVLYFNLSTKIGRTTNKLRITQNDITFQNFQVFEITNKEKNIVLTSSEPKFKSLKNAHSLHTKFVETNRISSSNREKLKIEAQTLNFKGSEGTFVEGKTMTWNADKNIYLKSMNGSIVLSEANGTFIDIRQIPMVKTVRRGARFVSSEFKMCVCMPQGKIFKIPVMGERDHYRQVHCHEINFTPSLNPCI